MHSIFLRSVYLLHHSNCSHPFLKVVYLCLSQKEWQSSILWKVLYLFWQEKLQSSIVWVIPSAVVCLFPKNVGSSYAFFQRWYNYFYRILAATHPFNDTVHFSDVRIWSHPILPTHFLSAYLRTLVTVKQTSYPSNYIVKATSSTLKSEHSLEATTFLQKKLF